MANFSYVIDSNFKPFELQEMLTPFLFYKDVYDKEEAKLDEINEKAGVFDYLRQKVAEDDPARQIYEGYMNDFDTYNQDFSRNGLTIDNRPKFSSLKRRYNKEIGRLEKADKEMEKEKEFRRTHPGASSMLYATPDLKLSQFLDGSTPDLYSVSKNDLYARGEKAARAFSSREFKYGDAGETLGGYYRRWFSEQGINPESVAKFMADINSNKELKEQMERIKKEYGIDEHLGDVERGQAEMSIINGMIDGIVYTRDEKPMQNLGVLTKAEETNAGLTKRGQDLNHIEAMASLAESRAERAARRAERAADQAREDRNNRNNLRAQGYILGKNGEIIGYNKKKDFAGMRSAAASTDPIASTPGYKNAQAIISAGGKTTGGNLLTFTSKGDITSVSLGTTKNDIYMPWFGKSAGKNAGGGFTVVPTGADFSSGDATKIQYDDLASPKAKKQIVDYVNQMYNDLTGSDMVLPESVCKRIVDHMIFERDQDWFSNNEFRLYMPGVDPETGQVVNKTDFLGFLTFMNKETIQYVNSLNAYFNAPTVTPSSKPTNKPSSTKTPAKKVGSSSKPVKKASVKVKNNSSWWDKYLPNSIKT